MRGVPEQHPVSAWSVSACVCAGAASVRVSFAVNSRVWMRDRKEAASERRAAEVTYPHLLGAGRVFGCVGLGVDVLPRGGARGRR